MVRNRWSRGKVQKRQLLGTSIIAPSSNVEDANITSMNSMKALNTDLDDSQNGTKANTIFQFTAGACLLRYDFKDTDVLVNFETITEHLTEAFTSMTAAFN